MNSFSPSPIDNVPWKSSPNLESHVCGILSWFSKSFPVAPMRRKKASEKNSSLSCSPVFLALQTSKGGMASCKRPASPCAQLPLCKHLARAPAPHANGACLCSPAISTAQLQTPHGPQVGDLLQGFFPPRSCSKRIKSCFSQKGCWEGFLVAFDVLFIRRGEGKGLSPWGT